MQRIVLVTSTEHLDGTRQFLFAANKWIMVLVQVIHTGDKPSPGSIRLALTRLFLQMVVVVAEADKLTHEIAFLVAQRILKQKTGPRLIQLQHAHHQMGRVHRLSTAVNHLMTGYLYQLAHLCRGLWLILLVFRDRLYGLQLLL